MKLVFLFTIIFMLFFLWMVPIMYPFGYHLAKNEHDETNIAFAYSFWYIMIFSLSWMFGEQVRKNGCWFFNKN